MEKRKFDITDALDVVITAFEGGSNYWIERVEKPERGKRMYDTLSDGGAVIVVPDDFELDGETSFPLTLQMVVDAIPLLRPKYDHVAKRFDDPDNCEWDACDADVLIQLALFKEVIFG